MLLEQRMGLNMFQKINMNQYLSLSRFWTEMWLYIGKYWFSDETTTEFLIYYTIINKKLRGHFPPRATNGAQYVSNNGYEPIFDRIELYNQNMVTSWWILVFRRNTHGVFSPSHPYGQKTPWVNSLKISSEQRMGLIFDSEARMMQTSAYNDDTVNISVLKSKALPFVAQKAFSEKIPTN